MHPASVLDGTPHWRAQNQTAHAGLSAFLALGLSAGGLPQHSVVIVSTFLWVSWELTVYSLSSSKTLSCFLKSLADMYFYLSGILVVGCSSEMATLISLSVLAVSVVLWSIFGSEK